MTDATEAIVRDAVYKPFETKSSCVQAQQWRLCD